MLVKPNFDEVPEEVVPGDYQCVVKKGEVKSWGEGKGNYINWELETFNELDPKNNGRRVFYKTSVSGKGAFTLQRLYKAATGNPLTGNFDTEEVVGKKLLVSVVDGYRTDAMTGEQVPTGYTEVKSVKPLR